MKVCVCVCVSCGGGGVCELWGGWYTGGDVDGYWGTVCEGLLLCSYYKMEACPWDQTRKHCILTRHLLHLENTKYTSHVCPHHKYYRRNNLSLGLLEFIFTS